MSDDPADVDLVKPDPDEPFDAPVDEPDRRGRILVVLSVAVALVLASVGTYLYLRRSAPQPAPPASTAVERPQDQRGAEQGEQIPLPPLDETDPLVRELVGRLSSHPTVAAWLTTDGLILNFAVVTLRIANGESPGNELGSVGPVPAFRPQTSRGRLFVDPSSYHRYDRHASAVSALDARGSARLYATLKPRIVEAYKQLNRPLGSPPGGVADDFDPVLERAVLEMLEVPVVEGEIALTPSGIGYAFDDPDLEGLSAAQKHLLRMGPQNVRAIQGKLREIADYLGIPASRLPPNSSR